MPSFALRLDYGESLLGEHHVNSHRAARSGGAGVNALGDCLLTLDDCIAFGELKREVVLAIAEHERVPELSAVAIGTNLMLQSDGLRTIYNMIVAVKNTAAARGEAHRSRDLESTLAEFVAEFPGAQASA